MKIINATWEKRNLGVDTVEISIENNDSLVQLMEIENDIINKAEYLVVKVPVARFDINTYLAEKGFVFVESSINCQLMVKEAVLSPLQQRLNNAIHYAEMSSDDLEHLYSEIEKGLFKTDRILLDSNFTEFQASTRYVNWIKDELARTTQVYKIIYKEDTIGFFTFKEQSAGIYYPFLAGLYEKYASSGLGFTTIRKPIEEVIKRNGKAISTYVSSNNPFVVRAHTQQGYSLSEMHYVFVKHNKKTLK